MIKKIIISFIAILTVYIIVVHNISVHFPQWGGSSQNQWQANIIRAQEFAYGNYAGKKVIVGSSLSCCLIIPENASDFYNLCFAGGNPIESLGVIKESGILPSYIFIETNYYNILSGEIKTTVFTPILYHLKRFIKAFQEKYQPVNVLIAIQDIYQPMNIMLAIMQSTKKRVINIFIDDTNRSVQANVKKAVTPSQTSKKELVALQMKYHAIVPDPEMIKKSLEQLSMYTNYFEKHNVKIIFFEMPVEGSLYISPKAVVLRSKLHERFPPTTFTYLKQPMCQDYTTRDGIHLTYESSLKYSQHFLNEAKSLIEQ